MITFHSLEVGLQRLNSGRMRILVHVHLIFRFVYVEKFQKGKVITRKPIIPSEEEMTENKRSKSSKLRIFEGVKK